MKGLVAALIFGLLAFVVASSCGTGDADVTGYQDDQLATQGDELRANWSFGPWVVFADPYMDGGANPAANMKGFLVEFKKQSGTRVALATRDLPADHNFVAHAHVLKCSDMKGGGHYQNSADGGATAQNELHMMWMTSPGGSGIDSASVDWHFRDGGAQSLVVHDTVKTADGGIGSGAKLACINFAF